MSNPSPSMPDYATRVNMFGLASQDQVLSFVQQQHSTSGIIFLDVRTEDEIKAAGSLATSSICTTDANKNTWVHCSVTQTDATELENNVDTIIGTPTNKDVPIVVYCRSGARAVKAKQVLEAMGYTNILNAGGWDDIEYLK